MGLTKEDRQILEKLVRYHLLLPDIATRRDLEDPVTWRTVADAVGDEPTLELLRVLTAADGEATGSSAWSPWKADLVNQLADRTAAVLAGRPVPPGPPFPSEDHRRIMAAGGLEILPSARELVVIAPDRPGLFSDGGRDPGVAQHRRSPGPGPQRKRHGVGGVRPRPFGTR